MKFFCFLMVTFLLGTAGLEAQVIADTPPDSAFIKEYNRRIKLVRIDGKYIPRDLTDALKELDKIMEPNAVIKFKAFSEEDARTKTHFSFGKYLNVRWSIEEGSRLTEWFRMNKIFNHDDMIDCIITTYHRKLNDRPLEFEKLATYYYEKQKKKVKELIRKKKERDARTKAGKQVNK